MLQDGAATVASLFGDKRGYAHLSPKKKRCIPAKRKKNRDFFAPVLGPMGRLPAAT